MGSWQIVVGTDIDAETLDLAALSARVLDEAGVDLPEIRAVAPGNVFQRGALRPRQIALQLTSNKRAAALDGLRARLIAALAPGRSVALLPCVLRSLGAAQTLELRCYYLPKPGDFDSDERTITLRFVAYEPWYATAAHTTAMAVRGTLAINHVVVRRGGIWRNLGSTLNNQTRVILPHPDGGYLVAGYFTAPYAYVARYNADTGTWSGYGSGPGGNVEAAIFGFDGTLYIAGGFGVKRWTGSAWVSLPGISGGTVKALAIDLAGRLVAVGTFTAPAGGTGYWNGSAWQAMAGGLSSLATCVIRAANGTIIVGGSFAGGIMWWDGAAWHLLGGGVGGTGTPYLNALAVGPDGRLYGTGYFSSAGATGAANIFVWNGISYSALGSGLNGVGTVLACDGRGIVYVYSTTVTTADGLPLLDHGAAWNGSSFSTLDLALPTGGYVTALAVGETAYTWPELLVGCYGSGNAIVPGATNVTLEGQTAVAPVITVTGPGRLYEIVNAATGQTMAFDLELFDGETLTLDLAQSTAISDRRGRLLPLPGSAFASWRLARPAADDNLVLVLLSGAGGSAQIIYQPAYWTLDGAEL